MADGSNLPIILIEVVLVFGGVLLFGWWQLRSVKRDRERTRAAKAEAAAQASGNDASSPASPPPQPPPPR